jgi:disulfide oxidoreductase YuzD
MDETIEIQQLFQFKSPTVNMTFNKLPNKLKKKYEKKTSVLKSLDITSDTQLTMEINAMIKDISMDMVSFIINECGYTTADKEYKSDLLKTVTEFAQCHQIK